MQIKARFCDQGQRRALLNPLPLVVVQESGVSDETGARAGSRPLAVAWTCSPGVL